MSKFLNSTEIGRLIRYYRQNEGLSQEALAEKVGVSFQQIQKYENGHSTLSTLRLQQVASALNISAADFFEAKPSEKPSLSEREAELLKSFRKIKSAEMKDCIIKMVRNINKRIC